MRTIRMMLLSAALVAGCSIFAAAQWGGVYQNGVYVGQAQSNNGAYQRGYHDGQEDARKGRQGATHRGYNNPADEQAYSQGYAQGYQAWVGQNNGGYYGNGQVYAPNGTWNNGGRRHGDCDNDDAYCNGQPNHNYRGNRNGGYYGNGGSYGNAPYNPNGTYNGGYYGNGGYNSQDGMRVAQQYGYQDGLREGASDRQTGHSFRPTNDTGYRLATNGYQAQFGTRDQYRQWYRQAYQQGYQQGYNGSPQ